VTVFRVVSGMARKRNASRTAVRRRFGSEVNVEELTGISRRTLQKDRRFGVKRFPWYRSGRKILYDLDEVVSIIRNSAGGGAE